jgi:hypothetical protein
MVRLSLTHYSRSPTYQVPAEWSDCPFLFSGGGRRSDDSLDGALDEIALLRRAL